jgi:uncharacterized protein YciI
MLTRSTPEEDRVIEEHFACLKALTERGAVLLAGRTLNTDATSFGLVILDVPDEEEARRVMRDDPAVRAGLFDAELFPYRLALVAENLRAEEPA